MEDGGNKEWQEMDQRWLDEQKREFHEMDENNDGILTKDELLVTIYYFRRLYSFVCFSYFRKHMIQ